ncbi:helix-turn-helix transcriptional regulator [Clostridiaceae bacterium M8S5]|nr:helix-turn-helix transcriptional regulator [Clostridiaceae bacterium M8S5]
MDTIGKRVREARLRLKMTQSEVAGNFITRNMLSKIENDVAMPSIKTIEYLASVLDQKVSYFLDAYKEESIDKKNKLKELVSKHKYRTIIDMLENEENKMNSNSYIILQKAYIECAKQVHGQESIELYNKAKQMAEQMEYVPREHIIDIKLGTIGLCESNEEYNTLQAEISQEIESFCLSSIDKIIKAEIFLKKDKIKKARELIQDIEVNRLEGFWKGKYYYIRAIFAKEYDENEYLSFLKLSKDYLSDTANEILLLDIYSRLREVYSKRQDFERAYLYSIKENNLLKK